MANQLFNQVAMPRIPGNTFNLSHKIPTSFRIGELVPTVVLDVLPGDSFTIGVENMLRFSALIAPVMHRCDVYTHYFFVPYRILWDGFEDFITGESTVTAPYVTLDTLTQNQNGSIASYMGIPDGTVGQNMDISPLYFAAYRKIYDEYYRDENLIPVEKYVPLVSGSNTVEYGLSSLEGQRPFKRSLEHDYFTSALPFAQKGQAVQLPLTFQPDIAVDYTYKAGQPDENNVGLMRSAVNGSIITNAGNIELMAGPTPLAASVHANSIPAAYDPNGTLTVDVQSSAVTIDTLRTAIVLQEFLERDARAGTRYTEKIQGHFGVKSSDQRLQRPEYIGGSKQVMVISEVLSTAQTGDNQNIQNPVGQMHGHGISVGGGNTFRYNAEEFGCIIGIISVLPEPAYFQGIHRSWVKADPINDFAWPAFANLGEQQVYNYEIYAKGSLLFAEFGYQSRYAQYKSMYDRVCGEFRTSLNFWHMAAEFDAEPALNESFIEADYLKFNRVFAVTEDVDHIYGHLVNNIYAYRKLPRFGVPQFGSVHAQG